MTLGDIGVLVVCTLAVLFGWPLAQLAWSYAPEARQWLRGLTASRRSATSVSVPYAPPAIVSPLPPPVAPPSFASGATPLAAWWNSVIEHDAHIMLVGETRSGKSTTARALLAARARTDRILIIDPHAKFNDWAGMPAIGDGRDFDAIRKGFLAVQREFERRFKPGEPIGQPLTVFIDEYPAIASACPDVAAYFKQWLRESAKAKIRLVLLVQDANVKTLGIEGEGPVRENLLKILLGSFAVKAGATGQRPAALDRRGDVTPISLDGLLKIATIPVYSDAAWVSSVLLEDEGEEEDAPVLRRGMARQFDMVENLGKSGCAPAEISRGAETDFQAGESDFPISAGNFPLAEIARIAAAIASGKGKTETLKSLPGYSGRRHAELAVLYDQVLASLQNV